MDARTTGASRRLWITDGSLVPFEGVVRLPATHRATLGIRANYKGLIDPAVPEGEATLTVERADDVLVPEAEWCVLLPGGFGPYPASPADLEPDTPVVLQGIIEGKWLNRLLGDRRWAPASVGNNLLAAGPGIVTTFAAIEAGTAGEVLVEYQSRAGARGQRSTVADLRGQNVHELVRAVLAHCHATDQPIDAIDISAMGERAAAVNERARVNAALRFARLPVLNPINLFRRGEMGQRVIRGILADDLGVRPGTTVTIRTTDGSGATVGKGRLTLESRVRESQPI